jgi:hypothetical protein
VIPSKIEPEDRKNHNIPFTISVMSAVFPLNFFEKHHKDKIVIVIFA